MRSPLLAGYMRDKFVFSLISAVGIFCLGAGVSVWHGISGLMAAEPVEHIAWSAAGGSFAHVFWPVNISLARMPMLGEDAKHNVHREPSLNRT